MTKQPTQTVMCAGCDDPVSVALAWAHTCLECGEIACTGCDSHAGTGDGDGFVCEDCRQSPAHNQSSSDR